MAAALGVVLTAGVAAAVMTSQPALAGVALPKALILADSVTVPGPPPATATESIEQYEAQKDGFAVTSVTGAVWDKMTAAQFRQYQVIIIGDPACNASVGGASFAAALKNQTTWEPVVMNSGGNKVLIGTDPTFHYINGHTAAATLEANGIAFAGKRAGVTGAYVDLSCAYDTTNAKTPVPLLDGLSTHGKAQFTVVGEGSISGACATTVNIVAKTGPTTGLTDADLSNWSCSVHEAFDKFPSDYTPLALAPASSKFPTSYCADDVETKALACGSPYIMVSGSGVVVKSEISLAPATQTVPLGTAAKLVATVKTAKGPVSGGKVVFSVDSGPDLGKTFTGKTSAAGKVTFTYTDKGKLGTDSVSATYKASGLSQKATATVIWKAPMPTVDTISSSIGETTTTDKVSTTAPGDLLVAFVAGDAQVAGGQRAVVSGGGLTWKLVGRQNSPRADAEIWTARAAGKLTNVKVTVAGHLKGFDESVTIVAFKGALRTGAVATAHSNSGAPTGTLKTTVPNSWVFAVGADWLKYILRTPGAGQHMVHQATDHDADQETFWVQARNARTPKAGTSVTINDTNPVKDPYNLVLIEIV